MNSNTKRLPGRRLISSDEAVHAKRQHEKACSDCPWARTALNGWLGGASIDDWLRAAHGDVHVPCHVIDNAELCGGPSGPSERAPG